MKSPGFCLADDWERHGHGDESRAKELPHHTSTSKPVLRVAHEAIPVLLPAPVRATARGEPAGARGLDGQGGELPAKPLQQPRPEQ